MIKGLDRFRELATYLPEFEFTIIGASDTVKKYLEPIPTNLSLIPPQHFDQLTHYYQSASYYAQLSRSEGLPNSLIEAMLCGCIPVGTDVGDVGVIIGDTGITIEEWDTALIADFIRLNHTNELLRDRARDRILELYGSSRREERFRELMRELE